MHIHGNSMAVNAANFYSAGQNEKTAAAERAAKVRKKLLKNAAEIGGEESPEESLLIGKWMDAGQGQVESPFEDEDENAGDASGRDPDFG